ncbi:Growth hormone-regulated TBC protein [Entamoeba marina]
MTTKPSVIDLYQVTNQSSFVFQQVPEYVNRFGYYEDTSGIDNTTICEQLTTFQINKEVERKEKWEEMLKKWKRTGEIPKKLRTRVYKGVPQDVRKTYWDILMNTKQRIEKSDNNTKELYYVNEVLDNDVQIDLDVRRTLNFHCHFHSNYEDGKRELFLILRALSQSQIDLGYTQGMSDFAGVLLTVLQSRDYVFHVLNTILIEEKYLLKPCLQVGFPGLKNCGKIHYQMVKKYHPTIHKHLMNLGYEINSLHGFLFEWYMVWFSRILPCDFCLAVYDFCLLDGKKALYTVGSAVLHYIQKDLLETDDIHSCLQIMKCPTNQLLANVKCSRFIHHCKKHKITNKSINKWSKQ